jgi:hypothetical protein
VTPLVGQLLGDKPLTGHHDFHRNQEIAVHVYFQNVAFSAHTERYFHHFRRRFCGQVDDFRFRHKLADLSGGFDSVQAGKSDVQQNQVRSYFSRFPNCFKPIRHKINDAQVLIFAELLSEIVSPTAEIFYNQNADKRLFADNILLI